MVGATVREMTLRLRVGRLAFGPECVTRREGAAGPALCLTATVALRGMARKLASSAIVRSSAILLSWAVVGALVATGGPASAQGKLDARYVVTLAGVPLGKGAWVIDIADDHYTAAASGGTSGFLQYLAKGQGSSASRGTVQRGALTPQSYASSVETSRWTEEIRIGLAGGRVKDFAVEPQTPPNPERIAVTDAHRRGVIDPMSAALIQVTEKADPLGPEACDRKLSVFDGRMRYDIELVFKRTEQIKAQKGYEGLGVVCMALFTPIAGHIPNRPTVKYLIARRDMEVWLVPVAGTRVLVPYRVVVPTPLGEAVLQATQFVSAAVPGKFVPTSARAN